MRCPTCHHLENRVLESRSADGGQSVRRRRECLKCSHRFTTYERIESVPLIIVKQNGDRESFDREKLRRAMVRTCERTAVSESQIEALVSIIEGELQQRTNREVPTHEINGLVLRQLRSLSEVAYIRYASLHCEFENLQEFLESLDRVQDAPESIEATSRADADFVRLN